MRSLIALLSTFVFVLTLNVSAKAGTDITKGKKVYMKCAACHTLYPDDIIQTQGPNLCGVVGRAAASLPDYQYSPALKESGIIWTPDELDRFLERPFAAIPRTYMRWAGLPKPQERANLIAYLATQKCP